MKIEEMTNKIICGDALTVLKEFPDESIGCVMTSPPYWNLRDYKIPGQIGLESTKEEYLDKLFQIFTEIKRVLKKTGCVFVNLGDTYGTISGNIKQGNIGTNKIQYIGKFDRYNKKGKHKCLSLIPERFVIGMVDNLNWTCRNKPIWYKLNAMPESVKDRFSKTWEQIYFFTKSNKYYFDLDSIRIPHKNIEDFNRHAPFNYRVREAKKEHFEIVGVKSNRKEMDQHDRKGMRVPGQTPQGIHRKRHSGYFGANGEWLVNPKGKNPGDLWPISTEPRKIEHFATFPQILCMITILAGCPEGGIVLDPFCGSGVTCLVAKKLNRKYSGIDLKLEYVKETEKRIHNEAGLL